MENMRKGKIDVRYDHSDCPDRSDRRKYHQYLCTNPRSLGQNEKINIKKAANFCPSEAAF